MQSDGRCTRGFVMLELTEALREAEIGAIAALTASDHQLIAADGLETSSWIEQGRYLRFATAAREHACAWDWSRFHELCAASTARVLDLGYRAVVHVGDPAATFAAISVLWRASFNYGRAVADTDVDGATVHVIDCPTVHEIEGHTHAGWCLGIARLIGADCVGMELRRRPWADKGDEQVVRLHWRRPVPKRRPSPTPTPKHRLLPPKVSAARIG